MAIPADTATSKRNYRDIPPVPETVWQNPWQFIAFGFGAGAMPIAPGTFGTLITIPFYLALRPLSDVNYLIVTVCVVIGSMWICEKVSRDIGIHDHQGMCLDEVAGFLVTMFAAPHHWLWIVVGFLLFRWFDIWKPWPIAFIDRRVGGGFGMVLDDVLAGVYACLVLQAMVWLFLRYFHDVANLCIFRAL
ncbi:MAG: phosphatidylglycerophosphatase A [Pseudomonadota bacterium]